MARCSCSNTHVVWQGRKKS